MLLWPIRPPCLSSVPGPGTALLVRAHEENITGLIRHFGGTCITVFTAANSRYSQGNPGAILKARPTCLGPMPHVGFLLAVGWWRRGLSRLKPPCRCAATGWGPAAARGFRPPCQAPAASALYMYHAPPTRPTRPAAGAGGAGGARGDPFRAERWDCLHCGEPQAAAQVVGGPSLDNLDIGGGKGSLLEESVNLDRE